MGYRIAVDIGGTFTDCVIADADGNRTVAKALTTPGSLENGVLDALAVGAEHLGATRESLLAATDLVVHGTTQATNAIITRTGAKTGLLTTKGHEDAIIIGKVHSKVAGLPERDVVRSSRLRKPDPIVPRNLIRGITERVDRYGEIIVPLQEDEVVAAVDELLAAGVDAIAVALLWSFVNDAHERRIKEIVGERAPDVFSAYSHEVAPLLGEYERTATTAITAYVGPKVVAYLEDLERLLRDEGLKHPLLVMQASGGLTSVADAARSPIVTLDSGPTGGILGCQHLGGLYDEGNVICTDVGGTSFDVGLILHGTVPLDGEPVVAQYTLRLAKVLVHSIGSGGGSIGWIDEGGLLRVGPQSAGSTPGPACYGRGGVDATVTDADLVLGYLDSDSFLGGRMPLDRELAVAALTRLGTELGMEPEEVAIGVFRIINSQMADLIRKSTIEQGHDPRECVLVAYGGAGPTHAAFYGREIGSRAILVPRDSTVFSAEGMLTCDVTHTVETSRRTSTPFTDADIAAIDARFEELEERVLRQFEDEGADRHELTLARSVGMRFRRQVTTLDVDIDPGPFAGDAGDRLLEAFIERYAQVHGRGALLPGGGSDVEHYRVVGTRPLAPVAFPSHEQSDADPSTALKGERQAHFESVGFTTTRVYDGDLLHAGHVVDGPAVIERMGDAVVVPPGQTAAVDRYLTLRLNASDEGATSPGARTQRTLSEVTE